MALFQMDWLYLTFKDHHLYDEDGNLYCEETFTTEDEAEQYLIDNDLRASIN